MRGEIGPIPVRIPAVLYSDASQSLVPIIDTKGELAEYGVTTRT
jgi:hypothetical protein